jgi:adenylosuccinate synthase
MRDEVDWDWMSEFTHGYTKPEVTTVTKRTRRIAKWDAERNRQTVLETRPTEIAVTFLDYLWPDLAEVKAPHFLHNECLTWLRTQQRYLGVPITYVSTGPGQENAFRIDL